LQAALDSHREALIAEWTRARDTHAGQDPYGGADPLTGRMTDLSVPMPTTADAFMNLVDAGADLDAARRPHGARSTVIVHLDVDKPATLACTWVRCCRLRSVASCSVTSPARCGSNDAGRPWVLDGLPAP